jgi:hypothetical protein
VKARYINSKQRRVSWSQSEDYWILELFRWVQLKWKH